VGRASVDEAEPRETLEARCAKDADKLKTLLRSVEYRVTGLRRIEGWVNPGREDFRTETARRVAAAVISLPPVSGRDLVREPGRPAQ
jgi:putative hydrolase of HD superfamily